MIPLLIMVAISWVPMMGLAQTGLNYNQFGQLRNSFNGSLNLMDPDGGAALVGRLQWVGLDDAPKSYWASGHVGVNKIGIVGVDLKQTNFGVVRDREVSGYIASALKLGENQSIGFSVGGGVLMHKEEYTDLDIQDPAFAEEYAHNKGFIRLDVSYVKDNKYYIGLSAPRMLLSKGNQDLEHDFQRVYYFTGGALFPVNSVLHIRPSVMVSYLEQDITRFDVNALAFFKERLGVGLGVQNQGNLSGLFQFNIGDFGIGYSYQFNTDGAASTRSIANNTHEIGLRYRVGGMNML